MNRKPFYVLLVSIAWIQASLCGLAEELPVFIFAGQSIAINSGTDSGRLPAAFGRQQTNVYFYQAYPYARQVPRQHWLLYQPPTDNSSQDSKYTNACGSFGPEISAANLISCQVYGGRPVAVFKYAIGNTSLGGSWNVQYPNSLFWQMRDMVWESLGKLPMETGCFGRIAGVFWTQGETDAISGQAAAAIYGHNLSNLVSSCRREFDHARLPFVFAQLLPQWPNSAVVRASQETVAATLADTRMVNADDLQTPNLHFDNEGTIELGNRYARAFVNLVSQRKAIQIVRSSPNNIFIDFFGQPLTNYYIEYSTDFSRWSAYTNAVPGPHGIFRSRLPLPSGARAGYYRSGQ